VGLILRHRLWILLFLTLAGGAIRFAYLDRPTLWGDEAFTYSRVCGDYREMLDVLVYDGFPPLHYEAYWALGQAVPLTPRVMRWIPAAAGTLMIPAMYFLAVQIVRRQAALLAALFTCISAYMMVYSRDAKMYMQCWLFVALNVGCLLWWIRTQRRVAWLAWIATGLAMTGMHLSAIAVLGVEPVIFLTHRVRWRQVVLFLAGCIVIGAGPAGYKLGFNQWDQQVDEVGFAAGSGVGWVESYNRDRGGVDLALFATTAHLFSWEWPSRGTQLGNPGLDPDVMHILKIVGIALLVFMLIGALNAKRPDDAPSTAPPESPWWRSSLWLSLWIMVPAYGIYCASMREFASPRDWLERAGDLIGQHWIICEVAIMSLAIVGQFWRSLSLALIALIVASAAIWAVVVLELFAWSTPFLRPGAWHNAYWPLVNKWLDVVCDRRTLATLMVLLPVIVWQRSGRTPLERGRRLGQFALLVAAILLACTGVYAYTVFHFNQLVSKTTADHHDAPQWEMFVQYAVKDHGVPAPVAAFKQVRAEFANLTDDEFDKRAIDIGGRVDERIKAKARRWDDLLAAKRKAEPALTEAQAVRAVAERLGSEHVVWDKWMSVWMPRYVGMCWPAVAIAACSLLLRVPTRFFRYTAIGLFLAVNMTQAGARIFTQNEPPMDKIYADIAAGQKADTRTYLSHMTPMNIGHPGSLGIFGMSGRYYLTQVAGVPIKPLEFRDFGSYPRGGLPWKPWNFKFAVDEAPQRIADELKSSPAVNRAIIWEALEESRSSTSDSVTELIGPGWKRVDEKIFHGRFHWTWEDLYTVRRREYRRVFE
jgi:4-amino-4-deoxy-L-arabinose transferase-like glycosyltransferase